MRIANQTGLVAMAFLLALQCRQTAFAEDKLQIYTVNYPLAYFAERIAGDLADVRFPAPSGVDPAFWMPDTETIAGYQNADLLLLNGADYAKWTRKVSLPRSRQVDTSSRFKNAYIQVANTVSHGHGPAGDHSHGGVAFTTWLDIDQAAQQAQAVADALARTRQTAKAAIDRNLEALTADLLALDRRMVEIVRSDPSRPLLVSHPVYQYLARRYGLNSRSLMWEPDEVPNPRQWAELEGMLQEHPAKWMLWEDEPVAESVKRLRALGVQSVVFDPCANRPETGDFLSVMSNNATALEGVFQ